ncbi:MAG: DNA gyrase inhibitor YacG [Burkholderiales bacterium]|nr:DNA gyrase inhibitor YacG [Burkholderiales bacterium]
MGAVVACPVCAAPVAWGPMSEYRPFCSERCRLIDLGAWANEGYRLPTAEEPDPAGDAGNLRQ